jgi:propanol-preferring alcohol dehydrogenase
MDAGVIHNARDDDPEQVVADLTGGKGAYGVIECSGSEIARTQTAAVAARHATVVFVGAGGETITLVPTYVIHKELTIKGNSVYSMSAYFDAVDFLLKHPVPLDDMVTHRFRIDQAVEAFKLFDTGETGKVIFDWGM